ncbi:tetratricopeptide repeat protein [Gemmatimonas sp.]
MTVDPLTELPTWLADGQRALDEGRYRDAAHAFARASNALPSEWALHQMTANAWRLAGDVVQERAVLRAAFAVAVARPTDIEGLYALGSALLGCGAPAEARSCFETVVAKRPRDAAALSALASARRADGDPLGAWPLVQRALTLAHKMPAVFLTAAQVRHALGDTAGARTWLAKAEKIRPGHPLQQIQLAFSHLIEGASAPGWAAFEARGLPALPSGARDWHGESLAGQSIAVVMEQGLGDLFHFVRYVRWLEARGPSRVVVECPPSTVSLLVASGFDAVPVGQLPPTDWAVPLLSLPHRLGSDGDTARDLVPYLRTGHGAVAALSRPSAPPRIGLVYKGNPAFLSTVLRDLNGPEVAAALAIDGVQWVWLQYGEPAPSADTIPQSLECPQLSGNWLDTASLMSSLDGIVTVDTAVAHLTGAMGLPVWVLVPHAPDWRWGLEGTASAWYPTATLVRQPRPRDWAGALERLAALLRGG